MTFYKTWGEITLTFTGQSFWTTQNLRHYLEQWENYRSRKIHKRNFWLDESDEYIQEDKFGKKLVSRYHLTTLRKLICRSISKLHPRLLLGNPCAFVCCLCLRKGEFDMKGLSGSREFEPCLDGMGNLNRKCQVFPAKYTLICPYSTRTRSIWEATEMSWDVTVPWEWKKGLGIVGCTTERVTVKLTCKLFERNS